MERFGTLNTATLSTWTHLAPNPARNTLTYLRLELEVIQRHTFWDR